MRGVNGYVGAVLAPYLAERGIEVAGFNCSYAARDGARQFRELFERIQFGPESYQVRAFTRLKQPKYLRATKQIDADFFWN